MGTKAARIKNAKKNPYRSSRWCILYVCVQWNMEAWTDAVDCTRIIPKRVYCIWCADFVFISFSFFFTRANTNTHANPFFAHYSRPIFFSPCHKLRLYCFQCVNNIIFQCQLLMYLWTNDSKKMGSKGCKTANCDWKISFTSWGWRRISRLCMRQTHTHLHRIQHKSDRNPCIWPHAWSYICICVHTKSKLCRLLALPLIIIVRCLQWLWRCVIFHFSSSSTIFFLLLSFNTLNLKKKKEIALKILKETSWQKERAKGESERREQKNHWKERKNVAKAKFTIAMHS